MYKKIFLLFIFVLCKCEEEESSLHALWVHHNRQIRILHPSETLPSFEEFAARFRAEQLKRAALFFKSTQRPSSTQNINTSSTLQTILPFVFDSVVLNKNNTKMYEGVSMENVNLPPMPSIQLCKDVPEQTKTPLEIIYCFGILAFYLALMFTFIIWQLQRTCILSKRINGRYSVRQNNDIELGHAQILQGLVSK